MARRILGGLVPAVLLALGAAACASVEPPRPTYRASFPQPVQIGPEVRANLPIPNPPERGGVQASDGRVIPRAASGYKIGKPYKIAGVLYVPAEQPDYDAVGTASWYGDAFHGKPTANGEAFDMHLASAAHATLPLPSVVEVTNLDNERSIQVRVNDRGPFKPGRIIDLSRAAADELGFVRQGVARVRVRYVGRAPLDPFLPTPPAGGGAERPVLIAALVPKATRPAEPKLEPGAESRLEPRLLAGAKARPKVDLGPEAEAQPRPKRAPRPEPAVVPAPGPAPQPAPEPASKPTIVLAATPSFAVQAGSFANRGNAERAAKALGAIGPSQVREQQRDGAVLYRVLVGAWEAKDGATEALAAVALAGFPDAKVVSGS